MTNREEELLELIRSNPAISQNELADKLGIARSSVAVHITNLTKKGYILGKGYILKDQDYACVLGGANMDIIGTPTQKLIPADSNPGRIKLTMGGVGRNIAENLVRLGVSTKLITVLGEDVYGRKILDHANQIGLDMRESLVVNHKPTSTYLAILDENKDMVAAVNQMNIMDELSVDFIQGKRSVIEHGRLSILDTNIREDVLRYVLEQSRNTVFFLDTVSTKKAEKIRDMIGYFHTIKPNRIEAEMLSGISIRTQDDMRRAAEVLLEKGVKRVFITLGPDGVFYHDRKSNALIPNPKVNVVNATGAGDAFVAGLSCAYFNHYDTEQSARFAMATAILALESEETINPNVSMENVQKKMKELGLC
jgi:pseudouridine kinase